VSIADWFKAREDRRYTVAGAVANRSELPDGVWQKCPSCSRIIYQGDLERDLEVCPQCGHHGVLAAERRIALLADEGTFEETDAGMSASDPLGFTAAKSYTESLAVARERTGMREAFISGRCSIGGHPVIAGAMDFRFIAASMGSVVGEKVARVFDRALDERRAVVIATASGGARMQEGMLSLMQMAKTAAAARRLSDAGLPYVSVLTDPTFGGVTASFATLADVILAEPGAHVGFTGPRVIEQTIRQKLPKGFQTAEMLETQGLIDAVVPRAEIPKTVATILGHLMAGVAP